MANPRRKAGTEWENTAVEHAQARGLPWDRSPSRGTRDLLDVQGCLPDGWLIGMKSIARPARRKDEDAPAWSSPDRKLSEYMAQCRSALANAAAKYGPAATADLKAAQVIKRAASPGKPLEVGRAYAVMEFDTLLSVIIEARVLRNRIAALEAYIGRQGET